MKCLCKSRAVNIKVALSTPAASWPWAAFRGAHLTPASPAGALARPWNFLPRASQGNVFRSKQAWFLPGLAGASRAVSILSFCRTLSLLLTNVFFVKPWEIIFPLPHIGGNTTLAHDFLMGFSCPNCSSLSCILEPAMSLQMPRTPLSPALPPFLSLAATGVDSCLGPASSQTCQ